MELEQRRLQHIYSQPLRKFRPTEEMINEAFKNTVEPKQAIVEEHLLAKGVKNYGLRKQGRNDTIKSKKEINKN